MLVKNIFIIIVAALLFIPNTIFAGFTRDIHFPVDGPASFNDNFNDPRSGGRDHEAVDILADKMTPLVAVVDGTVRSINIPEAFWGYSLTLKDAEGYTYHYLHINNDTLGTDDGNGGVQYAYAPGISRGKKVSQGDLLGWVGDSGNAEGTVSHLHFELRTPGDGIAINPYESLIKAANNSNRGDYVPASIRDSVETINDDKSIDVREDVFCDSGSLIKILSSDAVYYCGADGKRYVFPNDKTYFSWYDDFSEVKVIEESLLPSIPIGGNVTYRPGVRMVKIQTDPKVYAVDRNGTLRWIVSDEVAEELYGSNWNKQIDDISDAFFVNYNIGPSITGEITIY